MIGFVYFHTPRQTKPNRSPLSKSVTLRKDIKSVFSRLRRLLCLLVYASELQSALIFCGHGKDLPSHYLGRSHTWLEECHILIWCGGDFLFSSIQPYQCLNLSQSF